ncbi:ATPase [Virgibacillus doumboii]|uniref:ATPase n=1 Tax=Virgibacillus doumboii TaxID=2697503 RepID=UPI0013E0DE56|nr:ATPase [Virgibacillus doumboii]
MFVFTVSRPSPPFEWTLLIPILVVLIFSVILSVINRNKQKTDKGVKANYFRLSYRRKFVRTLWTVPVSLLLLIAALFLVQFSWTLKIIIIVLSVVAFALQASYNYIMWKRHEA